MTYKSLRKLCWCLMEIFLASLLSVSECGLALLTQDKWTTLKRLHFQMFPLFLLVRILTRLRHTVGTTWGFYTGPFEWKTNTLECPSLWRSKYSSKKRFLTTDGSFGEEEKWRLWEEDNVAWLPVVILSLNIQAAKRQSCIYRTNKTRQ